MFALANSCLWMLWRGRAAHIRTSMRNPCVVPLHDILQCVRYELMLAWRVLADSASCAGMEHFFVCAARYHRFLGHDVRMRGDSRNCADLRCTHNALWHCTGRSVCAKSCATKFLIPNTSEAQYVPRGRKGHPCYVCRWCGAWTRRCRRLVNLWALSTLNPYVNVLGIVLGASPNTITTQQASWTCVDALTAHTRAKFVLGVSRNMYVCR